MRYYTEVLGGRAGEFAALVPTVIESLVSEGRGREGGREGGRE